MQYNRKRIQCLCLTITCSHFAAMKLLENSSFEALSSRLCVEMGESRILGRWVSRPQQQTQHTNNCAAPRLGSVSQL